MKTYPRRTFIHRVLIVRLEIAAPVIAIIVGLCAYGFQHSHIEHKIVDLGRRG
jgi:hypothetical protein